MPRNASPTPPNFQALRKLPPSERLAAILDWWPNKAAVIEDVLNGMPKGTELTPSALRQWVRRGMSGRWVIPLLRAIERRHGLMPIRLSKVPAARRAAVLAKLRELYGLSIDWSVIEPMLADRQPAKKETDNGDS